MMHNIRKRTHKTMYTKIAEHTKHVQIFEWAFIRRFKTWRDRKNAQQG